VKKFNNIFRNLLCLAVPASAFLPAYAQTSDELLDQGRQAYLDYDFSGAGNKYAAAKKKLKKGESREVADIYSRQLDLARGFLERVENIVILDSLAVPKEEFFKAYRLPVSAGRLDNDSALPYEVADVEYVFTNEGEDFKMWAQLDTTGYYNIAESIRLTDGSWSEAHLAPLSLGQNGNAEFPFMMADGTTLYYASDGDESMGGYDIFIASRDPQTGEYLQPQNVGMPYNSPSDDYLLAIDELNGVGWWATDRNKLGDMLTVYLFKVNDMRRNYDPEEEEAPIEDLARISDFKATWQEGEDYAPLIAEVMSIKPVEKKKADFYFPMKGGIVYTSLDDFKTSAAKTKMKDYLDSLDDLNEEISRLDTLRREYSEGNGDSLKPEILSLEKEVEQKRVATKKLRNEIYRAEGN